MLPSNRLPLPIDDVLDDILTTLQTHPALVLCAPPGSGKTTRVPLALLPELRSTGGNIVLLEPRRIAARAVASFMARQLDEPVGKTIGYQVRFDKKSGPNTLVHVVTEGILTRRFLSDPFLEGTSYVIIDEFHERSVNVDLALCMLKETLSVRDDLKVIVMSATIDSDEVSRYLNNCPVIRASGTPFPLNTVHSEQRLLQSSIRPLTDNVTRAVKRALFSHESGNILVFLPGAREIESVRGSLNSTIPASIEVIPLYGALSQSAQDAALCPGRRRRIVLSTNIAETSLTIPNISIVVDSGLEKRIEWRSGIGFEKLVTGPISRFSATQRAGRAARTGPGTVYRLWTETQHNELMQQSVPEIQRVDPVSTLFTLVAAFCRAPDTIHLITPLPSSTVDRAMDTLRLLKLMHPQKMQLTQLGKEVSVLPLHPRLGLIVACAVANNRAEVGTLAAALLSERDILSNRIPDENHIEDCDIMFRMSEIENAEQARARQTSVTHPEIHPTGLRNVQKTQTQLLHSLRNRTFSNAMATDHILLPGYVDRVCKKNDVDDRTATMANGRGIVLGNRTLVKKSLFFLALDGDASGNHHDNRSVVSMASAVSINEIQNHYPELFRKTTVAQYIERTGKVTAREITHFLELEIDSVPMPRVPSKKRADLLHREAMKQWQRLFLDTPKKKNAFARLAFAQAHISSIDLPPLTDETIAQWILPYCQTASSLSEVQTIDLPAHIESLLPYETRQQLRKWVPTSITVPSGRDIPIDFTLWMENGAAPRIHVKLQELFGFTQSPTIGTKPIPLSIALLAPNGREVQITNDLYSFWTVTYPEVRKELRARYAKHFWPENPFDAEATHLTQKQFARKKNR